MTTRSERMLRERPHPYPHPSDGRGDSKRQPAISGGLVRRVPALDNPVGGERFCLSHQMGESQGEGERNL